MLAEKGISRRQLLRKAAALGAGLAFAGPILAACGPTPTPQVIKETVVVEKPVEKIVEKVKEVPKEVTKIVEKVVVATPKAKERSYGTTALKVQPLKYKGSILSPVWSPRDDPSVPGRFYQGELVREWNELHPGINVEMHSVGGVGGADLSQWMTAQFAAGVLPAVAQYNPGSNRTEIKDKWWLNLDPYLAKKNPYSPNATWKEDFPYFDLVFPPDPDTGEHYGVMVVITGDMPILTLSYNRDIFRAAGIDVDKEIPPKDWTAWMAMNDKIKAKGYIPFFQPYAGTRGWINEWMRYRVLSQTTLPILKKLDRKFNDGTPEDAKEPNGLLGTKEAVYALLKGEYSFEMDEVKDTYRIMKEFTLNACQPDWAAPPDMADSYFSRSWYEGKVGATHAPNWALAGFANIKFDWGTFEIPPISKGTGKWQSKYGGNPMGRMGSEDPAKRGGENFCIARWVAEKDPDLFAAVLDLVQYCTRPEAQKFYCKYQEPVPCFEPGTPVEKIWAGDKKMQDRMRGFFEPPIRGNVLLNIDINTYGRAVQTEGRDIMVEYIMDKISLDECMKRTQALAMGQAKLLLKEMGWKFGKEFGL